MMARGLLVAALLMCFGLPGYADDHGSVRVYKLNSKNQLLKQRWLRNRDVAGCHDLRRSRKIHRFAQTGFAWCTVYKGSDCQPGTELPAMWRGKNYRTADIDISQPQTRLLPGAEWYLDESKNIKMGSWYCEYKG